MLAGAASGGVRSVVDAPASCSGGSWFSAAMVKPNAPIRKVTYPAKTQCIGSDAWAQYLPDLAETVAQLAEIEKDLDAFEVFHFGGYWLDPGARDLRVGAPRGRENPDLPIRAFPWVLVYVASPFVVFMRELIEMRYLWQRPLRLDNSKLIRRLGTEPHTPLDEAVAATLRSMKAIP